MWLASLCSWLESLGSPASIFLTSEFNAIVKSTSSSFPEFDSFGDQSIASPELWPCECLLLSKTRLCFLVLGPECILVSNGSTLVRSPCTELSTSRSFQEVFVRVLLWHFLNSSFDSHRLFKRSPPEGHSCIWVRLDVVALFRFVVCKPSESSSIHIFKQHKSVRRSAISSHRG